MDTLSKYLLENEVIVTACRTTDICEFARKIHSTYPTSTAVLGRILTAAVIMGGNLKDEESELSISVNGGGPSGIVIATVNGKCEVRGCIGNPFVDIPAKPDGNLDVGSAIGKNGFLTVIKDLHDGKQYSGTVELSSGEIAEDLALYYLKSEQQPSVVYLSCWVDINTEVLVAGGIQFTPLPGAGDEILDAVEKRLPEIGNFGIMLMERTPDEIIGKIFSGFNIEKLSECTPIYRCTCSRQRITETLISLGKDEIKDMIENDHGANVTCRFCNSSYDFSENDLKKIYKRLTDS